MALPEWTSMHDYASHTRAEKARICRRPGELSGRGFLRDGVERARGVRRESEDRQAKCCVFEASGVDSWPGQTGVSRSSGGYGCC